MDALVNEGFIVAGGPLGSADRASRVLHIVDAAEASAVEARMREDPWTEIGLLKTISMEPRTVLLGELARVGALDNS